MPRACSQLGVGIQHHEIYGLSRAFSVNSKTCKPRPVKQWPLQNHILSLREKRPLLWFGNVCGFASLWAGNTFSKFAVCCLNVEFCLDKEILPKSKDLVPALLQMWMGNKSTKTTEKVNRWINNVTIDPQTGGSP